MRNLNWVELRNLEALLPQLRKWGRVRVLDEVQAGPERLPIYGVTLGSEDPTAPTLGLFGGVHGLERVGSHVVLNYLGPLLEQLAWDKELQRSLQNFRLATIPIVNPGGMLLSSRSNPRGVDIMRNAPVDALGDLKPLVSGHRYSPRLPWYRGELGAPMEIETQALVQFVRTEMLPSAFAVALDVHSGFGMSDRLWYPYSRSREVYPDQPLVENMTGLLGRTLPFHVYKIEPQSASYMMHGDPWDLLYDEHRAQHAPQGRRFLPWCLEMGSWTWLKKNPRQLFASGGVFNPMQPHRYGRIMRRHKPLLDFLRSAVVNFSTWSGSLSKS